MLHSLIIFSDNNHDDDNSPTVKLLEVYKFLINSPFHIEISGKISQNSFLSRQERTSEMSPFCQVRKVFLVYFYRNRDMNAIYHVPLTFRVIFWAFLSNFCSPEKQV